MEDARRIFAQDPSVPFKPDPCKAVPQPAGGVPAAPPVVPPYSEDILNTLIAIRQDLDDIRASLATVPKPEVMYYDTPLVAIAVGTPLQPTGPDILSVPTAIPPASGYQAERIYGTLNRKAPKLAVINDGTANLFVISTSDGHNWSSEVTILTGEGRMFYDVFEIRLRSPTAGNLGLGTGGIYRAIERDFWLAYSKTVSSGPGGFTPLNKGSLVGQAQAGGVDIFLTLTGASITPSSAPTTFRVMVAMSVGGGTFSASINDGINPVQIVNFNAIPGALVVNGLYIFDMLVSPGWTVDFRYSVASTIEVLSVQELDAATA